MGTHTGHKIVSDKLHLSIDASNPKTIPSVNSISDMSNRKHTVYYTNGTTRSAAYPASKFTFDGVDDRIDTNITGRIDSADGFSVETWFRGTKTARNHMWDFGNTSSVNFNCNFNDGPYALWFYWEGSGGNNVLFRSADGWNFTDSTIKHLVFTHSGTENKVYLNGVEISPYTKQGTQTMANVNATGYYRLSGSAYGGDIYINRVYKKALSAEEVYNNFRADKDRFGV
jgi:hypothetical protein